MLWSHGWTNKYSVHANTPIYKDGYLYCVSGYGKGGVKLKISDDGKSVKEMWRNSSLDNKMGGVILLNGKLYGSGDFNRKWFCIDWETGEELSASKFLKKGNIIFADGLLYCYSQSGDGEGEGRTRRRVIILLLILNFPFWSFKMNLT